MFLCLFACFVLLLLLAKQPIDSLLIKLHPLLPVNSNAYLENGA